MQDLDALKEQLFSDGINRNDFITHSIFYQKCARCKFALDDQHIPVLLKCGHVCCLTCAKGTCYTGNKCNQKIQIVKQQYSKLIQYWKKIYDLPVQQYQLTGKTYIFSILTIQRSTLGIIDNVKQTDKIEDIINRNTHAKEYYSAIVGGQSINIQGKSFFYDNIKKKKLHELKIPLKKQVNTILIFDRLNGGRYQLK